MFANNEHRLPAHTRGYYHEYTVPTPRASDRATRRIVTGADGQFYYTDDHYESFRTDQSGRLTPRPQVRRRCAWARPKRPVTALYRIAILTMRAERLKLAAFRSS